MKRKVKKITVVGEDEGSGGGGMMSSSNAAIPTEDSTIDDIDRMIQRATGF